MSAASVAVMYSDRKKTARAFVKFFCFFSGRPFPPSRGRAEKPVTAGFLVKSETSDALTALWKYRWGSPWLWTSFLFSLGKARKTGRLRHSPSKALRFFPIKMKKLILLS
ncbi:MULTISPECIES: hypothetical protein [unclassified Agrobacterium]|uniref:hypothetical protein n=1 Tax=unclassified Agrobacterium TaxID=2632611 RepID=UPI0024477047|nr:MULTISPECIES: hypothetical protein [unclassified Agrobacterium]MDH0695360.1 hypothetical protein [Agrobacterium sp. GD03871]MDH1058262.1 hypothetical protein [Agrobacterium sp. GD03992]MDH2219201.1 hypothetical protein [Agrobacterium sp. GD03638]